MTNRERADQLFAEASGITEDMRRALQRARWNLATRRPERPQMLQTVYWRLAKTSLHGCGEAGTRAKLLAAHLKAESCVLRSEGGGSTPRKGYRPVSNRGHGMGLACLADRLTAILQRYCLPDTFAKSF